MRWFVKWPGLRKGPLMAAQTPIISIKYFTTERAEPLFCCVRNIYPLQIHLLPAPSELHTVIYVLIQVNEEILDKKI